jgi:hypothetical protein
MADMNYITQLLTNPTIAGAATIIAAFAAVVSIFLVWRANKFAEKCARAQKILEPSDVEITFFGHRGINVIIVAAPLKEGTVLTTHLDIVVHNKSKVALDQAQFIVRANKSLSYGDALDKTTYPQSHPYGDCHTMDNGEFRSFFHNIKQPFYSGLKLTFRLPITLMAATLARDKVSALTHDNLRANLHFSVRWLWAIDTILLSVNGKPFTKRIGLYVVDTLLEAPMEAIASITSKDVKRINEPSEAYPFLFAEISKDKVQKDKSPRVYSANIESESLKIGFFDEVGGQVIGAESPENPLRDIGHKFLWAQSHGYSITNKH